MGLARNESPYMSNPKRHHYLPESYLRRFASGGFLWLFDRSQSRLRREQPKNTAVISHYYSLEDKAGIRSPTLEQHLSLIESLAAPAIDRLESGRKFDREDRYYTSHFLGSLFCRVPAFERALNEMITGMGEAIIRKNLDDPETAESFDLPPNELFEYLESGEFKLEADANLRAYQIVQGEERLAEKIFNACWIVARAPSNGSFATCDSPFGRVFPPGRLTIPRADTLTARAFPLSSNTCMVIHGRGSGLRYLTLDRDAVRTINLAILSEAETYAFARDEAHLRSLALAAGLHDPAMVKRVFVDNFPDPAGDETKSMLCFARRSVR
jgi:hypothetical protein